MLHGVLDDAGAPAHVFVRAVGARSDEADLDVHRPLVLLGRVSQPVDGVGKVGGEGAVDVGLKLVEVDLDDLVVFAAGVGGQEFFGVGAGLVRNFITAGSLGKE